MVALSPVTCLYLCVIFFSSWLVHKLLMNGSKELWQMLYWDLSGLSKEEANTALE